FMNPRFARVTVNAEKGSYGLSNEGFRGIGVIQDKQYDFSVLARKADEGNVRMKIQLIDSAGANIGEAVLNDFSTNWQKHSVSLHATATKAKARLYVLFEGNGIIDIDMVSLFPHDTWRSRPNGLRADLVQMLADLK